MLVVNIQNEESCEYDRSCQWPVT